VDDRETSMTVPGDAVLSVDNVLFAVSNLDAAVDFYAGKLGFPLVFGLMSQALHYSSWDQRRQVYSSGALRQRMSELGAAVFGWRFAMREPLLKR
jgi:catechol 2,3-dioxygenase-like lactoylglutathione lyase family enzyme